MRTFTYIAGLVAVLATAAFATPLGMPEVTAILEKARLEARTCDCICVVSVCSPLEPSVTAYTLDAARRVVPRARLAAGCEAFRIVRSHSRSCGFVLLLLLL